ncbi:MAG: hypothetical protein EAZ89_16805, partial [Bacteroidetes bacterium]
AGVELTGLTAPQGVSGGICVLPIRLLAFSARPGINSLHLLWTLSGQGEKGICHIERSAADGLFSEIAQLPFPEVRGRKSFTFEDAHTLPGLSYYRLRIIEANGNTLLSDRIEVNTEAPAALFFQVAPSPVATGQKPQLQITSPETGTLLLEVFSSDGRTAGKISLPLVAGYQEAQLPWDHLPGGIYLLKGHLNGKQMQSRFTVR